MSEKKKKKKKSKKTPGQFGTQLKEFFKKAVQFLKGHKWIIIVAGAVLLAGLSFIAIMISRKDKTESGLIEVTYRALTPDRINVFDEEISTILVRFNGSVAPLENIDKPVENITISPEVPGVWKWEADNRLLFTPEKQWEIGTEYTVRMDPSIFVDHIRIDTKFSFTTDDLVIHLQNEEFYIDPQDSKIKRVTFAINANYPMDPESLNGKISLVPDMDGINGRFENRQYNYTISYDEQYLNAYVISEALGMPAFDVDMKITVDKGIASTLGGSPSKRKETGSITVPGSSTYVRIQSISHELVRTQDQRFEQVLIIRTKGEINHAEMLANLSVWQLPEDRPELPGLKAHKNHRWGELDEMVQAVLDKSTRITPEAIPNQRDYSPVNSYRIKTEPGSYVYIKLNEGTRFYGDYFLARPGEEILQIKQYPKELEIMSEGTILSMTGDRKLTLMSRGIKNIQFRAGRIRPDDINHLVTQSSGNMQNMYFNNYRFNEYNITEQYYSRLDLRISDPTAPEFFSFDFSRYLETIPEKNLRYGLFMFQVWDRDNSGNSDRRFIMVTDLGFFVKKNSNGTRDIFVQSISRGQPVEGALFEVLGKNGNPIFSADTGFDGHISLPMLTTSNEHAPTVYVIRKGNDLSYMPYDASDRNLDYSDFNVGGEYGVTDPNTINAFLFSDRGIYRPGDEIRTGMLIKAGDWSINLANTPLECNIRDSRGTEVFTKRIRLSASGMEEIKYRTMDYSPTGIYNVSLYLIKKKNNSEKETKVFLGSTTVKVEEFLPDNLTITTSFLPLPEEGWIHPDKLKGLVSVRNLFGTPAAGNTVNAQITLSPGYKYFRNYRDYRFFDPYKKDSRYEEYLGEMETNDEGLCEYDIDLSKFEKASYNVEFFAEASEKGSGRKVSNESAIFVSPLDYMIGYKVDGETSYIKKDSGRQIEFIAIGPDLKKKDISGLVLTMKETTYISALVQEPNGLYKYQSVPKEIVLSEKTLNLSKEGLTLDLPTDKAGEFSLSVSDSEGLVFSNMSFSVMGQQNIQRSLDRTAELEVSLDKNDYQNGESIELFIKAPYKGAELITIEREKVYAHKWFMSDGTSSTQRITVPADLAGNGYICIAYVRDIHSPEIYMSPLCYSAVPFSVSKEKQTNKITLDSPAFAKPGQSFPITYKTEHPGKIIVFAVDEGILKVADYDTPDPIAFFFRKRALEVSTQQILDLVLPEFSVAQSLAAMGGGEGAGYMLARNLNPFKRKQNEPVAYWSGILDSDQTERTVNYSIPDYFNGSLRIMAITVSDSRIGTEERTSVIRDTFIMRPNNPMSAAPGDEFEISVTLGNNLKGSGPDAKINLELSTGPHLSVTSSPKLTLTVPEGKDIAAVFTIKVNDTLGGAELHFTASQGHESSRINSYLSVRPAVPYRTSVSSGSVSNGSETIETVRKMYPEPDTREVSLSYLPLGIAKGLDFYLMNYPYGCTEQIVSASFPHLYSDLRRDLGKTTTDSAENILRTVSILQSRQKSDGSFGLWTVRSEDCDCITCYAAHFLTSSRERGFFVPDSLLDRTLKKLQVIASSNQTGVGATTDRAYAIYVLTLNEMVTTSYIEALRKDLKKHENWESSFRGLFMAGSYAMLQQHSEAKSILKKAVRQFKKEEEYFYYDHLAYVSLFLHVVGKHFPEFLNEYASELLEAMAGQLRGMYYTTFSANLMLMAVDSYLKASPKLQDGVFSVSELHADKSGKQLPLAGDKLIKAEYSREASALRIDNKSPQKLFFQVVQAGFDAKLPTLEEKHDIEVVRIFKDEKGREKSEFELGERAYVTVRFRSLKEPRISQVAIVDLVPAGFEFDIASVREAENNGRWTPDFVDIREDRLVIFGNVTNVNSEFTYAVTAINRGKFIVPPLFAEAMYDKSVWAIKPQAAITVK
ncbi:MAG: hypothetical protein JW874_13865 [Spirochaetales bacterium]|nr:hypothetical protein [Spirochaetales bacterium]